MKPMKRFWKNKRGAVEYTYRLLLIGIIGVIVMSIGIAYITMLQSSSTKSASGASNLVDLETADRVGKEAASIYCPKSGEKDKEGCKTFCYHSFGWWGEDGKTPPKDCRDKDGNDILSCKRCEKICDNECQ